MNGVIIPATIHNAVNPRDIEGVCPGFREQTYVKRQRKYARNIHGIKRKHSAVERIQQKGNVCRF